MSSQLSSTILCDAGALLSGHAEMLLEMVEVLGQRVPSTTSGRGRGGAGGAAKQARLQLFQARSHLLQACVSFLSQLAAHPSRRMGLVLIRDWLKFTRLEGLYSALPWLPDLLAHLLQRKLMCSM
jgi:hypothetical protein